MVKERTLYVCQSCGASNARWLGRCPACGAWNTLVESVAEPAAGTAGKNRMGGAFAALAPSGEVRPLAEIEAEEIACVPTGQAELDRVLGGGIVAGGVVLIGGDPGIGKSTLLLQALDALERSAAASAAGAPGGLTTLYVTGEESGAQVALRARRLGLAGSPVAVLAEIQLEKILATLTQRPITCGVCDRQ